MKKNNNKQSLEGFEVFRGEEEKRFLNWFVIGDIFFLLATLILMFVSENVFDMNVLGWEQYWILFFANTIFLGYFIFSVKSNFKIWLIKYLLAIYAPLLIGGWIYFLNPEYTKVMFAGAIMALSIVGFIFYNSQVLLVASFTTTIMFGFLFFHLSRIGFPLKLYEISSIYIFLWMGTILYFTVIERTKVFLKELVETRSELQEAKDVLEIKVIARTKELEELTKTLDQKVGQRTKELEGNKKILEKRVDELERFHKLTVDRELRMLELKKEIQKLKGKNKKIKN